MCVVRHTHCPSLTHTQNYTVTQQNDIKYLPCLKMCLPSKGLVCPFVMKHAIQILTFRLPRQRGNA